MSGGSQTEFDFGDYNEGECIREGFKLTFNKMQERVHALAEHNGFWEGIFTPENSEFIIPTKLALIHSEVSEALEANRNMLDAAALHEELADIVIRTMDLAEAIGCDLGATIYEKHLVNMARPYKHNKAY